ncbi:MAG: RNA-binding S4 domain-containing protein [Pseudomonadota bacterium]
MTGAAGETPPPSQRLDVWLWRARFFRTRTLSSKFVADKGVRVARGEETQRLDKPGATVRVGDRMAFQIGARLFVVEVAGVAERRGPAPEARTLYVDRSPPTPPRGAPAGPRPTKRDRRALAKLTATGDL